jgi:uncharacterized protein (TIGR02147 family)
MVNVFEYTDYRKYLKDFYEDKKKENPHYSYRLITSKGGINAGNFVKILKGERNLTLEAALKISRAYKLNKKETDYFQNMVLFCQGKNHEEKKRHFEKMMSFRESSVRVLNADQYEFYTKWYYTAVREILAFFPYNGDNAAELGKMILPSISEEEVKTAIDLLLKLNLAEKNEQGLYKRKDSTISTGNDAKSVVLNNFIINTMKLAEKAIDLAPGELNLSSVSLTVSTEDYLKIQEETRAFRRRILEIAQASMNPNRVYQLNIQVFPLTKKPEDIKK